MDSPNRVGGGVTPARPPTAPDMRFRIPRFNEHTGVAAASAAARPTPAREVGGRQGVVQVGRSGVPRRAAPVPASQAGTLDRKTERAQSADPSPRMSPLAPQQPPEPAPHSPIEVAQHRPSLGQLEVGHPASQQRVPQLLTDPLHRATYALRCDPESTLAMRRDAVPQELALPRPRHGALLSTDRRCKTSSRNAVAA